MSGWIPIVGRLFDVIDQAVVDKDKAAELRAGLEEMANQVYLAELSTPTVPWVDALHKMGRQIISIATLALGFYCVHTGADPAALMALAGGALPGAAYNVVKGRGAPTSPASPASPKPQRGGPRRG